jgi:hydrogenase small subunit
VQALELDRLSRPKLFYGQLIHENCPRRADFDKGKFAQRLGDAGCLYKLGCKGHYTYADCALRQWNNGLNAGFSTTNEDNLYLPVENL